MAMQQWPHGDDLTLLENACLVGKAVYLDYALPRGVRHALEIAIHGLLAVTRDASLEPQHGLKRSGWKQLRFGSVWQDARRPPAWW